MGGYGLMKVLLIDGNGLQWRSYFSKGLEDDGVKIGIYDYIFALLYKFRPDDILLFWDISKSRWRREYYPSYKADREKRQQEDVDLEELFRQVDSVKRSLKGVGIRQVGVSGVEADDLISWFSEYYSDHMNYNVVVATGDKDLWQLVNDRVTVYDHIQNNIVDPSFVENKLGVVPQKISDQKSITGDASDNIKGIKGIGPKTAVKLLDQYGNLEGIFGDGIEQLKEKKKTKKILEDIDSVFLSYKLVKSPSFYDSRWYLTSDEYNQLEEALSEELNVDPMTRQIVFEDIDDFSKKGFSYIPYPNFNAKGALQFMKNFELPEISYESLTGAIVNCRNCSLSLTCKKKNTPEIGIHSKLMFVLDRDLDSDGMGVLDDFLEEVGLNYSDIWLTFSKKCDSGYYPSTYGQSNACRWFLKNELNILKPSLVISFGSDSMKALTDLKGNAIDNVGELVDLSSEIVGKKVSSKVFVMNSIFNSLISEKEKTNFEYGRDRCRDVIKEFLND
jgi:DNA polymerase-1